MCKYIITINTDSYKPMKASEKNWERGTINDFMNAINGYRVIERSLKRVVRRIGVFNGTLNGHEEEDYFEWLNNPKNKCKITFMDNICGFERTLEVAPYGWKQGYFNVDEVINELKENNVVQIPFKWVYDARQYKKNYDGCYMQIEKVE